MLLYESPSVGMNPTFGTESLHLIPHRNLVATSEVIGQWHNRHDAVSLTSRLLACHSSCLIISLFLVTTVAVPVPIRVVPVSSFIYICLTFTPPVITDNNEPR